jgi:hypothetical protein
MSKFDELRCVHVEQIGYRYPDAGHVQYAWVVDPNKIESRVFFGDEAVVFTSILEADGTIRHYVGPYQPNKKSPRERAFV